MDEKIKQAITSIQEIPGSEKFYYSLTCDNPKELDKADEIIAKYKQLFTDAGIKFREKDRRS